MNFNNYLEENGKAINEELDLILSNFLNETKKTNIKLLPFALGLINSNKGGKRIRGVLLKLGYEIASPAAPDRNDVLKAASALEILHTSFLIHDDIIDKSSKRRGQPSLYKALGGGHLGIAQAITVGDIGLYLPVKIITDTNFLGEYKLKALKTLSGMVIDTGWGQIMDIEKDADLEFVQKYKTAKYTISGPLQMGAILAGAEENLIKVLGEFGDILGIAFQIQDDILDGERNLDEGGKEALEYASKAKKMIEDITVDEKMRNLLIEMCDFMVEKKS